MQTSKKKNSLIPSKLISVFGFFNNSLTISIWPFLEAQIKGVLFKKKNIKFRKYFNNWNPMKNIMCFNFINII